MSKHGEPWTIQDTSQGRIGVYNVFQETVIPPAFVANRVRIERAVECVNALAGLDPAAVKKLLEKP